MQKDTLFSPEFRPNPVGTGAFAAGISGWLASVGRAGAEPEGSGNHVDALGDVTGLKGRIVGHS